MLGYAGDGLANGPGQLKASAADGFLRCKSFVGKSLEVVSRLLPVSGFQFVLCLLESLFVPKA